jgi:hypothetical protein
VGGDWLSWRVKLSQYAENYREREGDNPGFPKVDFIKHVINYDTYSYNVYMKACINKGKNA